jgi:hypothetical protein
MANTTRSPQEKKRLSYSKDRRNTYGENSKSSRKNIPHSKALAIRSQRHEQNQALHSAVGATSEDQHIAAELASLEAKPRQWRKRPDTPLGEYIAGKERRK